MNPRIVVTRQSSRGAAGLFVSLLTATAAFADAGDLLLVNANIVDPARREVREGNLLIRNGVIFATPAQPPVGFDGATLDLTDKWVIPGLVDLHTHTHGNVDPSGPTDIPWTAGVAERMLYAGVTSFLDLFNDEDRLFDARVQQRAGELGGADIFASLSCITAPGGHGTEYGVPARTVSSPEEARQAVASLALRHPDVVKIIYGHGSPRPAIDKPTLIAAVAAAKARSLATVVHVDTVQDVRDAVEAGAAAITHLPMDNAIPEELARYMAERGVVSIPTLTVHTDAYNFVHDAAVLESPLARAITSPAVIASYRSPEYVAAMNARDAQLEQWSRMMLQSVRTLADAGVTILSGTDSGSIGTIQGYSVHRELVLLAEAGLTPWQALAAATTDAAGFLGLSYGVQRGDEATLVVLDASPLEDVRNTEGIAYVIQRGVVVDRQALLGSERAGLRR